MFSCNEKLRHQEPPTLLERFTYWNGQALRSRDLNEVLKVAEARRLWHNRAVHNAFGVGYGLDATAVQDAKKNLLAVHVLEGLGYDASGAMLLVQNDRQIPIPSSVPDSASECLLLIRRPRTGPSDCSCSPPARCCLGETVRSEDWIEFAWKDVASVSGKDGLPVARLLYPPAEKKTGSTPSRKGQRLPQLDANFQPPRLRSYRRPRIAGDRTIPGSTPWELGALEAQVASQQRLFVWQPIDVRIDTAAAGFTETPCYFATLSGSLLDASRQQWLSAVFPHIIDEKPGSFSFRFWIPSWAGQFRQRLLHGAAPLAAQFGSVIGFDNFRVFARRQKLCIAWVGCELTPQAAPVTRRQLAEMFCGCGSAPIVF